MGIIHYEFAVAIVVVVAAMFGFSVWRARDYRREGESREAAVTLGVGAAFACAAALAALAAGRLP